MFIISEYAVCVLAVWIGMTLLFMACVMFLVLERGLYHGGTEVAGIRPAPPPASEGGSGGRSLASLSHAGLFRGGRGCAPRSYSIRESATEGRGPPVSDAWRRFVF